jgi:hypothetical protein
VGAASPQLTGATEDDARQMSLFVVPAFGLRVQRLDAPEVQHCHQLPGDQRPAAAAQQGARSMAQLEFAAQV